ncbi:MAG: LysR family transcriptional regulator [Clostridiales bacterium]|nr:LysR family transcriptional regulator [Clostridiales bacterium]
MTLDQIRYFASAAELLHMGKAAEKEHISQPSLSIAIKKLEKELGVPLFRASGRGIEMTVQGKEFLPYAQGILRQVAQATEQMQGIKDKLNREIHAAYTTTIASAYIPKLFRDFLGSGNGEYRIYSHELPSDQIVEGLKAGNFDFGICSKVTEDGKIIQIPIMYQPLVMIRPKGWNKSAELSDLIREPFVSYLPEYPMYAQVNALLERLGQTVLVSYYAYSEDAIARLVEQGLGISIVARTESMEQYAIEILSPVWLNEGRYIYLTYLKNGFHGKAVNEMMKYILSHCDMEGHI